jgi:FtsP/CotA-like multicopper oxidase with cupredoxin domain
VGLRGARLKLVGGDSGHYEHEAFVESVLIAPSERVVVDILFDQTGQFTLEHRTPDRSYSLATITVRDERAQPSLASQFGSLRTHADMVAERARLSTYLEREPEKTLALVAEMDLAEPPLPPEVSVTYVCPMHAEVISDEPGRCPKCGMKLMPAQPVGDVIENERAHRPAGSENEEHTREHVRHAIDIEWEDDMVQMNRMTTPANMRWKLIDRGAGAEGRSIDWRFRVGDRVKIRLVNEMDSDHPMPHPFHIHGAGRFLILSRDGIVEPNLVWKDTVLVSTGQTVDILLDVTNPGMWMAHCHIAEHHESGMMFSFRVDP